MDWALILGLCLGDIIEGRALVLGLLFNLLLRLTFGLVFWACAPIILNPINYDYHVFSGFEINVIEVLEGQCKFRYCLMLSSPFPLYKNDFKIIYILYFNI